MSSNATDPTTRMLMLDPDNLIGVSPAVRRRSRD